MEETHVFIGKAKCPYCKRKIEVEFELTVTNHETREGVKNDNG